MPVGPSAMSAELVPSTAVDVTLGSDFDLSTQFVAGWARELYVGTGGTVVAVMRGDGGTSHTYMNVPNGSSLYGDFVKVMSTSNGTTASNIVARY